jgi:UDP-glucuronate 4-epimerase
VVGVDDLNPYYDVGLKEARLGELKRSSPRRSPDGEGEFQFIKADIADRGAMEKLFAGGRFDAIVNLAAQAGVR